MFVVFKGSILVSFIFNTAWQDPQQFIPAVTELSPFNVASLPQLVPIPLERKKNSHRQTTARKERGKIGEEGESENPDEKVGYWSGSQPKTKKIRFKVSFHDFECVGDTYLSEKISWILHWSRRWSRCLVNTRSHCWCQLKLLNDIFSSTIIHVTLTFVENSLEGWACKPPPLPNYLTHSHSCFHHRPLWLQSPLWWVQCIKCWKGLFHIGD